MQCFYCFEHVVAKHVGYLLIEGEKVPFHIGMMDCRNKYLLEQREKPTLGKTLGVIAQL